MAAVLAGIAQHCILAGDVGEAPEVGDIGELGAAGRDALVAARPRDEAVALGDGAHRRFQQGQAGDAAIQPMRQHSVTRPAFAPLVQVRVPDVNQPASNPDSPEAMNARSRNRSVTTPVPL
jgi:hypothetical protein